MFEQLGYFVGLCLFVCTLTHPYVADDARELLNSCDMDVEAGTPIGRVEDRVAFLRSFPTRELRYPIRPGEILEGTS